MPNLSEKSIILSFDEIRILLYSLGFTSCEGIYMPRKEFTPQEIIKAIFDMVKRGLLIVRGEDEGIRELSTDMLSGKTLEDGFIMDPALHSMMMAMGNPGGSFEYRPGEDTAGFYIEYNNGPEYYVYVLPDYYLVADRDWTRSDSLRLRAMNTQSFLAWRDEREEEERENGLMQDPGLGPVL